VVDNVAGARLAATELVRLGHRAIGALFGPRTTSTGRDREDGFRAVLSAEGIELAPERWRRGPFEFDSGHQGALELLETAPTPPTALFCANDVVAIGAYNALRSRGVAIPGELTLIGFDDIALAAWTVFQLTTVRQDIDRMVQRSAEMLLERIAEQGGPPAAPPRRVVLAPTLVERATHGPPGGW
jgi:LacI family transcriptional regulator